MDGSFACPECGSEVEVEGLAPGRQVRCAVSVAPFTADDGERGALIVMETEDIA